MRDLWLVVAALAAVVLISSLFFLVVRSQNTTTAEEAAAGYSLSPFLANINFSAADIYVLQGDQVHSVPQKGQWRFSENYQKNGSYPHSANSILPNLESLIAVGNFTGIGGSKSMNVRVRFNHDDSDWWLNSVLVMVHNVDNQGNGSYLRLTTLNPLFPDNVNSDADWESQIYNQALGERIPLGESFQGDIVAPLYRFAVNKGEVIDKGRWGSLVIKNARLTAFTKLTAESSPEPTSTLDPSAQQ